MYIVLIIGFVFLYIFFLYTRIVKAIVYKTKTNWVLYIYIYIERERERERESISIALN